MKSPNQGEISHKATVELLQRLQGILSEFDDGQTRLDNMVIEIAKALESDVCSIYLMRDTSTLELCATTGFRLDAIHVAQMRLGEGLVGQIAQDRRIINAANASKVPGFRYIPETGEEIFTSFLGVPLLQQGEPRGVLVVRSKESRRYSASAVESLQIVTAALSDMAELGKFASPGHSFTTPHTYAANFRGTVGQEGIAEGRVLLHEPRVLVSNPVAEDPEKEIQRLRAALSELQSTIDRFADIAQQESKDENWEIFTAYQMFARSRGWVSRLEDNILSGLSAEASVEKEQSKARAKMRKAEPFIAERLHDLDDLANRLLRILTGQDKSGTEIPSDPILVARNIGAAELFEYGRQLKGIVLEEGSFGSHASIIARSMGIPLLLQVKGLVNEALNGDPIFVDSEGKTGQVYLRPDENMAAALHNKFTLRQQTQKFYTNLRDLPAQTRDKVMISLHMNAGVTSDLPSLVMSGAEGVGLYRTELQFLSSRSVPKRQMLVDQYSHVLDSAKGRPVCFRTVDIGSDKILPYAKQHTREANPAMGWRAIRISLDRHGLFKMQLQALIRGSKGRPISVMFPMIAEADEFFQAKEFFLNTIAADRSKGYKIPSEIQIGAVLETPSLAFAPDGFFQEADFISIGGNDLQQFFFAADRTNERVRSRYSTLSVSYLSLIEHITARCDAFNRPVSYCGEAAGIPLEAVCLAAAGVQKLSMRAFSIGRVKHLLRQTDLSEVRAAIHRARNDSLTSVRDYVFELLEPHLNPDRQENQAVSAPGP